MFKGKTILIAPLDWGLGHATRCVPVIRNLKNNNALILGVTPQISDVFRNEFPDLPQIELPSYNITYSKKIPVWLKILLQWPKIKAVINREQQMLDKIIQEHKIDVVISDNRFGLVSSKAHSVFITHQLFLKTPFAKGLAQSINKKYILGFKEVWVPDYQKEEESLAGELSHGKHYHKNVKYIGPQTRLKVVTNQIKKYDVLILLSGPEPQQSKLGNYLISEIEKETGLKYALVANSFKPQPMPQLEVFNKPDSNQLSEIIAQSKKVICRSGYSTLMDLHLLGKNSITLIPTPGQTEQEYLAIYWKKKFGASVEVKTLK